MRWLIITCDKQNSNYNMISRPGNNKCFADSELFLCGSSMKDIRVESYAGSKAEEYPLCFHLFGKRIDVVSIKDRWLTPDSRCFKVLADDDNEYVLEYDTLNDSWNLKTTSRPRDMK